MEKNNMTYLQWAKEVQKKLEETDIEWKKQYSEYASNILKYATKIGSCRKKFHVPKPLECYLTLGNSEKGKPTYDLRYKGQSVGTICVDKDGHPKLLVNSAKSKTNESYFGYEKYFNNHADVKTGIIDESWSKGKKAKLFRKFFREEIDKQKMPRSIEHMVEMRLFQEFAKKSRKDKTVPEIQPIKFGNSYTHMKTALQAHESKEGRAVVKNSGGEIDIFCRRKVSPTESRLTVIEVKDKAERNESFKEAMYQAISYAVFIRELIHSSSGNDWMKIWGINSKITEGVTINAVVAIPVDSNEELPEFSEREIFLDKDKIELHYMVIKKSILEPDGEVCIETGV